MSHLMIQPADVEKFLLAGHATITLKSLVTGVHFTYRVDVAPMSSQNSWGKTSYFVKLLTSPDEYRYLGLLTEGYTRLRLNETGKSCAHHNAPSFKAFEYLLQCLPPKGGIVPAFPKTLEVRHEGRCGRCGRELTVPESIDRGIGPECWEKMAA